MTPLKRLAPLVLLVLFPVAAHGGVPSAANSTVPACLVACPLGDIAYTIVVRDLAHNPLIGSAVTIDFSSCPSVAVCTVVKEPAYTYDHALRTVRAVTDNTGTVTFPLHAGGLCATDVRVYADGVLLATTRMASPDQDHDLVVVAADYLIFAPKLGTNDLTGDFDCDGLVDEEDSNIGGQHGSHSCGGIVNPVQKRTWGSVRSFYR